MQAKPDFQPTRVFLLIRNALVLNRSSIAVTTAAVGGVLMLVSLLDVLGQCRPGLHRNLFLLVLFSGGTLVTSRSFKELHDPIKGLPWLLLPASLLEKTLARILLTTVVVIAGSMVFFFFFSLISEGVNTFLFNRRHALFQPFDPLVLKGAMTYTAAQAPFLLGAVYFRKHALSKTTLGMLGFTVLFSLGVYVAARLIFGGHLSGLEFDDLFTGAGYDLEWSALSGLGRAAIITGKVIFWLVLPLVSWTACYFRLKETER
ncbi:MAG: hypothetical protein LJE94_10715 [Deltaproteobacteria bacterium]|nr:hypothetical protein [Deltaproteobacteria bacterium]